MPEESGEGFIDHSGARTIILLVLGAETVAAQKRDTHGFEISRERENLESHRVVLVGRALAAAFDVEKVAAVPVERNDGSGRNCRNSRDRLKTIRKAAIESDPLLEFRIV